MEIITNSIVIRKVTNEDLIVNKDEIINLLIDNYQINFPDRNGLDIFAENNYANMIKYNLDNTAIIYGAFSEDTIIGFLWAYRKLFLGEKRIHIGHIIVGSHYRGNKIGSRLMNSLEIHAIEEQIYTIELMTTSSNIKTINFYKSKGFNISRVQFEKKLGDKDDN